jgi:hypothetical protein
MKAEQHLFKWRHFQADLILLRVRWYLRYALSYRDIEEMMRERGCTSITPRFTACPRPPLEDERERWWEKEAVLWFWCIDFVRPGA